MRATHRATLIALITMLAGVSCASTAFASPLSDTQQQAATVKAKIAVLDRQLQTTSARYGAALKRALRADRAVVANSRKLDMLLATTGQLQVHLNARAAYMYRSGPLGYLDVLLGSRTFEEFSSDWDLLTQMSADDASSIYRLKTVRSQALSEAQILLGAQAGAAGELRDLAVVRAGVQAQLAQHKALLAGEQSNIQSLESAAARLAAASAAVAVSRPPSEPRSSATGSGGWSSAIASWYGPGSYGSRMADGEVLEPDSMIVANKTLPFGTLIEFSYGGRTAVAKVADRGPYVAGREFDLGPGTARVLDFGGVGRVRYRIIGG